MQLLCIKPTTKGILFYIKVNPNQKTNQFLSVLAGNRCCLKVSLKSLPVKGQANIELISFLAEFLELKKSSFSIISGVTSKHKVVLLQIDNIESNLLIIESKITDSLHG